MWTFTTKSLGRIVTSKQVFPTRKEAWEAAVAWADICFDNGEIVPISVIPVANVILVGPDQVRLDA